MSRHEARGTKRICQNEECALPFYDLNRPDCSCPNCGTRAGRPVELVRGPARQIVEEPEQAATSDDAEEEVDSEGVADNILELDEDESDDVEVDNLPGRATDE
jgi:hypothetical protein